jgi:hypothetical protein
MLTRRRFTQYAGTGILSLATFGSSLIFGCSSSVFDSILAWIPVATKAINGIVSVLGSLVPPSALAIIDLINAALSDLAATIMQYQSDTNPADKNGWLAKIRTILANIITNFQSFLASVNAAGPIELIVEGLASVVLAALAGFLGQLPSPGMTSLMPHTFHLGIGQPVRYTEKYYKSVGQFKSDFNAVADSHGHPEIDLH